MTTEDKLNTFNVLGLDVIQRSGGNYTDCPWCNVRGKFSIIAKTGVWRCPACEESGNIPTLMKRLHAESFRQTDPQAYIQWGTKLGVPGNLLKTWGGCISYLTREFLIPAYNVKGKLANLYRMVRKEGKYVAMSTPNCKPHPFGTKALKKDQGTLWVTEGIKDGLNLMQALQTHKLVRTKTGTYEYRSASKNQLSLKQGVIALPGANTGHQDVVHHAKNRTTILALDNDHPKKLKGSKRVVQTGWDQTKKIAQLISESGHSKPLKLLTWGPEGYDEALQSGYDISDILKDESSPAEALGRLRGLLRRTDSSLPKMKPQEKKIEYLTRTSWQELLSDYHHALHFTPQMHDTLLVMLATVISTPMPGDQIWIRVIGPPGCGKSTLAEAVGANKEKCLNRSIITGFHSGFTGKGEDNGAAGLMDDINGKTYICKDADTLTSSPSKEKILGEMRDIFDGTSRAQYRNNKTNIYEGLRTTFVLCGTDELRSLTRSVRGERFLDLEILDENEDRTKFTAKSIDRTYDSLARYMGGGVNGEAHGEHLEEIKGATAGFIEYFTGTLDQRQIPHLSEDHRVSLQEMGELLSHLRAPVVRDKGDVVMRARRELSTRIANQLTKLSICIALILEKPSVDREVIKVIRKVMRDTSRGFRQEIVHNLYQKRHGLSVAQIARSLSLAKTSTARLLRDMLELKIISKGSRANNSGVGGRDLHLWKLNKSVRDLYHKVHNL